MLAVHELLGRDIDPIDDIRGCFESYFTQSYFEADNGDWISDDYFRIIDLTTQPGSLNEKESGKLNRAITRLNGKYDYIERLIGSSTLFAVYNSVAEQVNAINSTDPYRAHITLMQSAPTYESV